MLRESVVDRLHAGGHTPRSEPRQCRLPDRRHLRVLIPAAVETHQSLPRVMAGLVPATHDFPMQINMLWPDQLRPFK